jgi:cytochrome c biogenesis protein CcdA/thiol-disulfide isomerase/thioredoxin
MIVLFGFALLAGVGTALSPCVLPVLPALLSAGGVGGRRRPLGIVLGLSITFTITIVGVAKVVGGVGLGTDPLRAVAVVVMLGFGLTLLVPGLAQRVEAPLSRLSRFGPRTRGDGFASGLLVGAALGFVYTPCAGPILAAIISVSAASGRTVAVAVAYAAGSALALFVLTLGGRRLLDRLRAVGGGATVQRTLGVVMILTGFAIVANLDVNFDQFVARHIPQVNLTASLEKSKAVTGRLSEISGHKPKFLPAGASAKGDGTAQAATRSSSLPDLGTAPPFTDTQRWFNTPGGSPITLASLRGRVVLVDFWTYTCINCIRTLPYLTAWDATYRNQGLTIVGVHSPEFSFEHDAGNVSNAVKQFGIRYPVVQDNNLGTWNAYGNQYWPADYLIDATGQVRYAAFGEGDYAKTESAIRALLAEKGVRNLAGTAKPVDVITPSNQATPETYLGAARAMGWLPAEPTPGAHRYTGVKSLPLNAFSYTGGWQITPESGTAVGGAQLDAEVQAKHVYLVLSSAGGKPRTVQVLLDGRPIPPNRAGADVHGGVLTVTNQRLYTLVSAPSDERHRLALRFAPGVSGYAFTFG